MIFANILKLKMAGNCFWVTIPRSVEGGRLPCPTAKSWLFYCISISEHFVISSTITYSSSRGLLRRTSLTMSLTTVLLNLKVGCFSLLCSFLICVHLEDVQVLHLLTQQWFLYATILDAMPTRCSKALQQMGKEQWAGARIQASSGM